MNDFFSVSGLNAALCTVGHGRNDPRLSVLLADILSRNKSYVPD